MPRSAPSRPGRRPSRAAHRCAHPHQDLLAVDERAGEVERGQVDPAAGSPGCLEGVHHARSRRQHGDPRPAYLAGDVDRQLRGGGCGAPTPHPPPQWLRAGPGKPARPTPRCRRRRPTARRPAARRPGRAVGPAPPRPGHARRATPPHRCRARPSRRPPPGAVGVRRTRSTRRREACRPGTGTSGTSTGWPPGAGAGSWRIRVCWCPATGSPRTDASSALSVARRRETASACSGEVGRRGMRRT